MSATDRSRIVSTSWAGTTCSPTMRRRPRGALRGQGATLSDADALGTAAGHGSGPSATSVSQTPRSCCRASRSRDRTSTDRGHVVVDGVSFGVVGRRDGRRPVASSGTMLAMVTVAGGAGAAGRRRRPGAGPRPCRLRGPRSEVTGSTVQRRPLRGRRRHRRALDGGGRAGRLAGHVIAAAVEYTGQRDSTATDRHLPGVAAPAGGRPLSRGRRVPCGRRGGSTDDRGRRWSPRPWRAGQRSPPAPRPSSATAPSGSRGSTSSTGTCGAPSTLDRLLGDWRTLEVEIGRQLQAQRVVPKIGVL